MASDTVGGLGTRQPDLAPDDAVGARRAKRKPAADSKPPRRPAKSRLDEWMEVDFKFGGSRIKRKTIALVVLGAPALVPLFFMLPALVTLDSNTFSVSVDDTLGTGAEIALFLCLLVTPLTTITGQRWFVPLRRWYGIMMAACSVGDAVAASITDDFAGGVFGRLAGHVFELMGFLMVMLVIPIVCTSDPWAQKKLGKYWKRFQRLTYVIWGLLACHLMLLEGFGFERGSNGSGFAGDGDAVAASITDDFAGGVFGRLAGHAFELMGFMMVMLVIPLLITSNPYSQRKLGKYWKRFQGLTYAIWALLAAHLILLEGFGFQRGANGSGFAGDGDPIFHQRFYQYSACSLFLLILRLPPARRWIAARQREGRNWLVYVVVLPLFALFVFGFIFILNEEIFKGIDSFTEHPSNE